MSGSLIPIRCERCAMCAVGTLGPSCDYWSQVAQRIQARYGEGSHMAWFFKEILVGVTPDEILSWDV